MKDENTSVSRIVQFVERFSNKAKEKEWVLLTEISNKILQFG